MLYAIDDNRLSKIKALAATDPNSTGLVDALNAAESDPLITSLIWTKADVVAACRKLIQGNNSNNAELIQPSPLRVSASPRDYSLLLAQEIAGNPDELCLEIHDEVDRVLELQVVDPVRDAIRVSLDAVGARSCAYEILTRDDLIGDLLSRLPEEVMAGGLAACAKEIAERAIRGVGNVKRVLGR